VGELLARVPHGPLAARARRQGEEEGRQLLVTQPAAEALHADAVLVVPQPPITGDDHHAARLGRLEEVDDRHPQRGGQRVQGRHRR
jgi:hypothetical protein